MKATCLLASIALLVACDVTDQPTAEEPAPLREQTESAYVTDSSKWGQLVFDKTGLDEEIAGVIEQFHTLWLDRDEAGIAGLLDQDTVRIRQSWATHGKENVVARIAQEGRGERPEGYKTSMHLTVRDVQLQINDDSAVALYRVDVLGGARWEFADMGTVMQVFHKTDDGWKVSAYIETTALGDDNAPMLPDSVPTRRAPFRFDFVYPVEDLERAIGFYEPLLGEPTQVTETRASFRVNDSFFELTTTPIDERVVIKQGLANGYAIVDVDSGQSIEWRLADAGTTEYVETPCEGGHCYVSEDPGGNIVVWRVPRIERAPADAEPSVTLDAMSDAGKKVAALMHAWAQADADAVLVQLSDTAVWIDDQHGIATGSEIESALHARWLALGAGESGIDADLAISNVRAREIGKRTLITFEADVTMRSSPKQNFGLLAMQVWNANAQLEQSMLIHTDDEAENMIVGSMDYTAYPVPDLGVAGRYYKTVLGSEPYRDENWFGFWSTSSVFGLVGDSPGEDAYRPVPHTANGYADLSIGSAEEVLEYLKNQGVQFPLVPGINDTVEIDEQPGYRQILAVDSEGNLINFSQYLEY